MPEQDAGVDRVAHEAVGAVGDQLRFLLLAHRHAPVAPEVDPRPHRQQQPGGEHDRSDHAEYELVVRAVGGVAPQNPRQDEREHDDADPGRPPPPACPSSAWRLRPRAASRSRRRPSRSRSRSRLRASPDWTSRSGGAADGRCGSRVAWRPTDKLETRPRAREGGWADGTRVLLRAQGLHAGEVQTGNQPARGGRRRRARGAQIPRRARKRRRNPGLRHLGLAGVLRRLRRDPRSDPRGARGGALAADGRDTSTT